MRPLKSSKLLPHFQDSSLVICKSKLPSLSLSMSCILKFIKVYGLLRIPRPFCWRSHKMRQLFGVLQRSLHTFRGDGYKNRMCIRDNTHPISLFMAQSSFSALGLFLCVCFGFCSCLFNLFFGSYNKAVELALTCSRRYKVSADNVLLQAF